MRARIHISLPVANIKNSVAFYSKVFQTSPTKLKDDYANFRLEHPLALHLSLVEAPNACRKSFENANGQHFGVELFDSKDLATWKEQVETAGIVPYLEEKEVTCCYAVADKFWLEDPDGNQWEFWVRHDDEGASLFPEEKADSACCAPTVPAKVDTCCR